MLRAVLKARVGLARGAGVLTLSVHQWLKRIQRARRDRLCASPLVLSSPSLPKVGRAREAVGSRRGNSKSSVALKASRAAANISGALCASSEASNQRRVRPSFSPEQSRCAKKAA